MDNRSLRARSQARPSIRADEVLRGLLSHPKTLPPKLFYDAAGAKLFEQISELPEYYLTHAELEILGEHASDIAALAGPAAALIEFGSGAGVKIRLLLDALDRPAAYVPIDVSREQLARVARSVESDYPGLVVRPLCGDYAGRLELPSLPMAGRRIAVFPGSTIGNMHPMEAASFLNRVRRIVGPGGKLVLGVDRRKDARTLDAAYNDSTGVTARFNLNILARLNRELGADFDLARFRHRAFFNSEASRIEMHLVSLAPQTVRIAGTAIDFEDGETIWTESSYKYDRRRLDDLVGGAGFVIERLWTDTGEQFWVAVLSA
jgi:L-histidine Nalpha-methyltransferase